MFICIPNEPQGLLVIQYYVEGRTGDASDVKKRGLLVPDEADPDEKCMLMPLLVERQADDLEGSRDEQDATESCWRS